MGNRNVTIGPCSCLFFLGGVNPHRLELVLGPNFKNEPATVFGMFTICDRLGTGMALVHFVI